MLRETVVIIYKLLDIYFPYTIMKLTGAVIIRPSYWRCSDMSGRFNKRTNNIKLTDGVLIILVTMAVIAVWCAAAAYSGVGSVYAADEKVTVGKADGVTVIRMDSISMGEVDLAASAAENAVSFGMKIQFEKEHIFSYDGITISEQYPDGATFTCGPPTNYVSYKQVGFEIRFQPAYLTAGTYSCVVRVPLDNKVNANGGVYKCEKAEYGDRYVLKIPVSITLKGQNPRLSPIVRTISAEAWNSAVEIRWAAPDDTITTFSVFRREGKDAAPSSPDLSKYSYLGQVSTENNNYWLSENGFSGTVFSDYFAENGKTYSYIVLSGGADTPYRGYPSRSVPAVPKASLRKKPAAPYSIELRSASDGIGLGWSWDDAGGHEKPGEYYEPENSTGEGEVDHFNIYQNGRLVKIVPRSAGTVSERYGKEVCYWETRIRTEEYNVPFTFHVTAVAPDGTESIPSNKVTGLRDEEKDVEIFGYHIYYTTEEVWSKDDSSTLETTYTGFDLDIDARGLDYLDVSRKPAGAPDSSYTKVDLIRTPERRDMDTGVKKGSVYTYKIVVVSSDGQRSDPLIVTVAADGGDWQGAPGGHAIDISFRTADGESAMISWSAYDKGTYRIFRDGRELKSWTAPDSKIEYTDDPGSDGRHEYHVTWTSSQYPEVTTTSNSITFIRDTSDPDPDTFDKAPGKPVLSGRVVGYDTVNWLQLMWSPSEEGGAPDGYVIYRTDGGIYNTHDWDTILSWGNPKRNAGEEANGRFWCTGSDVDRYTIYGFDESSNNGDSEHQELNPHKIWIVAYNEVGYSEPSNVLEYVSTEDGMLPWDTDDSLPGAPENVKITTSWTARNYNYTPLEHSGTLNITWGAPATGGGVDHYKITVYHPGYSEGSTTVSEKTDEYTVRFGAEQQINYTLWDDFVGLPFTVTVTAVNNKGETSAKAVMTTVTSIPLVRASSADDHSVKLDWTGLLRHEKESVKEFRIYRRANSSKWETVKTIPYGKPGADAGWTYDDYYGYSWTDTGLEGSTTYEYYVDAVDKSGVSHKSATCSATLKNIDAPLGAPGDLKAKVTDGDVILSWKPSGEGGIPAYYRLYYQSASADPEDSWWYSMDLSDSFGMSTGAVVPAMNFYSYYDEISDMIENHGGEKLRLYVVAVPAKTVDRSRSGPSNTIEVTWPTEDQIKRAKYPPEPITPEAEAGDGKVTLRWNKRKPGQDESEATYYQILRTWGDGYGVVATFPADRESYEWVDTDVVNGEKYTYELRPCSSYYYSYYSTKWWYHQWCYMHQVQVVPNGMTDDQKTADNISAFAEELLSSKPSQLSDMTAAYHDLVMELQASYANTTAYQRRLIGNGMCGKIEDLINEVLHHDAEMKYEGDPALAGVIDLIDSLDAYPAGIGLDDEGFDAFEEAVKAARAAYRALPDDAAKIVPNIDKLTDREAYIKQLRKDAQAQEKADSLSDRMAALIPDNISEDTLTDELERYIRDLRWEYDSMTRAEKAKVRSEALANLADAEDIVSQINGGSHKHVMQFVEGVPPTCVKGGNTAYYKCVKCGACSSDAAGEKEIAEESTLLPPDPDAHRWGAWGEVTGEPCIADGARRRVCELCGAEETDPENAASHAWNGGEVIEQATCGTNGLIRYTCERCGAVKTEVIPATGDHRWDAGTVVRAATEYETGLRVYVCSVCGGTRTEVIPALSVEIRLSKSTYTWDGKVKTPSVTVISGGSVVDPSDYIVSMPAGRRNTGIYTISVTMTGDSSGTFKAAFRIVPKGTSIIRLVRAKKSFTVRWKQQKKKMSKARVTGYQIQYSLKKNMKSSKTVTVKGWKKSSAKVKKLKARKTYYVRIRTYMKSGGKNCCSAWSKVKKVKTK